MDAATRTHDPHNLERFVSAQSRVWEQVITELRNGRKHTHWMWFIFPQIAGLGHSDIAQRFAISGKDEALAYLDHAILGPRLRQAAELVNEVRGRTIEQIFGYPDDLKFRSSMTLFHRIAPAEEVFRQALARYFGGKPDTATLTLLERAR